MKHSRQTGLALPPFPALEGVAFLFDLDGTLAPLASRPADVGPEPRRTNLLTTLLRRLDGRVAILSGRSLATVDHILAGTVPTVAGIHGLAIRIDGAVRSAIPPSAMRAGLLHASLAFATFARQAPGLLVEDKTLSVTLHFRNATALGPAADSLARRLADETGLVLQRGSAVVELRLPGATKGDALRTIMASRVFAGARPWFFGDDLTDEDAFLAAADLGGAGIIIGGRAPTVATSRIGDVGGLFAWLDEALEADRGSISAWIV